MLHVRAAGPQKPLPTRFPACYHPDVMNDLHHILALSDVETILHIVGAIVAAILGVIGGKQHERHRRR